MGAADFLRVADPEPSRASRCRAALFLRRQLTLADCAHNFSRRSEVFQAQNLAVVVVREDFGVPAPVDYGIEHPLYLFLRQVILELAQKPRRRCAMAGPLVEDATDVRSQRHML